MSSLVQLAREATKREKELAKARAKLAKVKAQKRPRKKTLESVTAAVETARTKLAEAMEQLGKGERAPNPAPAEPGSPAEPGQEGAAATGPLYKVVCQMIVDAHSDYIEALEGALDLLERTPNPHVRGYSRSPRVRAYERGESRFFGRSSGYRDTGR